MTKAHLHLQPVSGFMPAGAIEGEPSRSVSAGQPARFAGTAAAADPAQETTRHRRRRDSARQLALPCGTARRSVLPAVTSPHGGATAARQALNDRFADRVAFDP